MSSQIGGGKCSLCGSDGTNITTCPLNPKAKKIDVTKHPLAAGAAPAPIQKPAPAPIQKPAPAPIQKPAPAPIQKPAPAPIQKPAPAPIQKPAPAPIQKPAPAPIQIQLEIQKPAPAPIQKPAPKLKLKPKPLETPAPIKDAPLLKLQLKPKPLETAPPAEIGLEDIYLDTASRIRERDIFRTVIDQTLMKCLTSTELLRDIDIIRELGRGGFGVVKVGKHGKTHEFAIKQAMVSASAITKPWNYDWSEVAILSNIIAPLLEKGVCPNLPLIYSVFACRSCEAPTVGKKPVPCLIIMSELASGDLNKWLTTKPGPSDEEVYSALFQIMAGLYALQKHAQFSSRDFKSQNILYYNVKPGGHWVYNIHGKTYYVPNYGKLFVLADFGISVTYMPGRTYGSEHFTGGKGKALTSRTVLGLRPCIIINKKITPLDGATLHPPRTAEYFCSARARSPFYNIEFTGSKTEMTVNLTPEQKAYMLQHGLPIDAHDVRFFSDADITPEFSMSTDVLDGVGMFIGDEVMHSQPYVAGKPVKHSPSNISPELKDRLRRYIVRSPVKGKQYYNIHCRSMHLMKIAHMNAGYFIDDFFGNITLNYLASPASPVLGKYTI